MCTALIVAPGVLAAEQHGAGELDMMARAIAFFGAGIAIAVAGFGTATGMAHAASAAVGAVAERPEIFGRTLLYIVFIEAIAIYALVVAFMILVMY
ncbi:MAG: ATP synthase subunit C [Candidatus Nezhaarchaeales archaeon]